MVEFFIKTFAYNSQLIWLQLDFHFKWKMKKKIVAADKTNRMSYTHLTVNEKYTLWIVLALLGAEKLVTFELMRCIFKWSDRVFFRFYFCFFFPMKRLYSQPPFIGSIVNAVEIFSRIYVQLFCSYRLLIRFVECLLHDCIDVETLDLTDSSVLHHRYFKATAVEKNTRFDEIITIFVSTPPPQLGPRRTCTSSSSFSILFLEKSERKIW